MSEYPPASCDIHPRIGKLDGFFYNTYNKYAIMNDPDKKTNNIDVMLYWLKKLGYCDESACACVGCAMYESQMNPAAWEFQQPYEQTNTGGYGLFQWTPWTIMYYWWDEQCKMDCNGAWQMRRFGWEYEYGQEHPLDSEWQPVAEGYGWTWDDFKRGYTDEIPNPTLEMLVEVFQRDYLRGDYASTINYKKQYAQEVWDGWKTTHIYHPKNPFAWLYYKASKLNRRDFA